MADDGELIESPLANVHRSLGAKLVEFGGWSMPLAYPTGTIEEHLACRRDAVVFDVSHLGTVRVEGADAFDALQSALTNDLAKIGPGRAQYTHLLVDADARTVRQVVFDRREASPRPAHPAWLVASLAAALAALLVLVFR